MYLKGQLIDSLTFEPIQFAHVVNYSTNAGTITDPYGNFSILAKAGDTLVFSQIGYERLGWQVKRSWFEGIITLKLPKEITVLEEVVINEFPSEEKLKKRILEYEPEDTTFRYFGMDEPIDKEDITLNEKALHRPLFVATHPLTAAYYNFSKQEKERRKYHKIVQNESIQNRVYAKFTRDWVHEVTGLKGDELTNFISFCDYSLEYLDKTPLYIIQEDMLARLSEFKKDQNG